MSTLASLALLACVPQTPTAPTTTTTTTTTAPVEPGVPIEVDDAQLSWGYSGYAQDGALASWSQLATGDDVVINWADGQTVSGKPADAGKEFMLAQFDGGEGTIDSVTGEGTISWETGDWTLNAYQGSFGAPDEILSDPILDIEADGSGTLSFDLSIGAGLDMSGNPSPAVGPERHTAITFSSLDELGAGGLSASGDFEGRAYDAGGTGTWQECMVDGVVTGGSWPKDWTDYIPDSLRPHYYTTSCGGKQLLKPPMPFSVRWDDEAPAITRQPTLSTTSFALGVTLHDKGATVAFTGSPTPVIQWQRSADGVTWTDVVGAVGSRHTLPLGPADNGARIRAVLDNGVGEPVTTNVLGPITVAVTPTTLSPLSPGTAYAAPGGTATFSLNVTGSPLPTFQWERSNDDGLTWSPQAPTTVTPRTGGIRTTLVVPNLTLADNGAKFRLRAWNGVGGAAEVVANPATLLVQFYAPSFGTPPLDATVFQGQGINFTTNSVPAQPAATLQWEFSTDDGSTWNNWVSPYSSGTRGALQLTGQDTSAGLNGALFRLRATNPAGVAVSTPARLMLIPQSGQRRILIVPSTPIDPTQPVKVQVIAEGFAPPPTVTSNISWLVTHSSKWQPGQPINTEDALFTTVAGLAALLANSENNGMLSLRLSLPANVLTATTGEYGVALVGTDAGERFYDWWTPLTVLSPTP